MAWSERISLSSRHLSTDMKELREEFFMERQQQAQKSSGRKALSVLKAQQGDRCVLSGVNREVTWGNEWWGQVMYGLGGFLSKMGATGGFLAEKWHDLTCILTGSLWLTCREWAVPVQTEWSAQTRGLHRKVLQRPRGEMVVDWPRWLQWKSREIFRFWVCLEYRGNRFANELDVVVYKKRKKWWL